MIVKMHEAKTRLSELVAAVEAGEEVIIARGDKQVARLTPIEPTCVPVKAPRVPGRFKGQFELTDAFFEPLPEEELALWEGRDD